MYDKGLIRQSLSVLGCWPSEKSDLEGKSKLKLCASPMSILKGFLLLSAQDWKPRYPIEMDRKEQVKFNIPKRMSVIRPANH